MLTIPSIRSWSRALPLLSLASLAESRVHAFTGKRVSSSDPSGGQPFHVLAGAGLVGSVGFGALQ